MQKDATADSGTACGRAGHRNRASERLNVLVIEDNPGDARLVREHLAEDPIYQFEVVIAPRLSDAFAHLETGLPDAILLDLSLPDSQGVTTFARLMARAGAVPIVILTGLHDDGLAMEAIHRGAQDYVLKGEFSSGLLARTLRYAVERKKLEEQLRQAQRLDAIGQLAGGVAHDFNNILTVIEGHCELCLMDQSTAPGLRESIEQIRWATERAANLTRQLLAFGRRQMMRPRLLDIDQLIQSVSKVLQRLLGEPISLVLSCATDLPLVRADQGMMEQMILNLIVNARDAMPKGGELKISTSQVRIDKDQAQSIRDAYPGDFVRVRVQDNGSGIRPEVLPRIFEPFFTTKDIGQGTGLGLATVYGILQQHAGWITAQSPPGQGAQFDVYLPVSYDSRDVRPGTMRNDGVEFDGKTVLVVEDETSQRRLVRQVLERNGFRVLEAADGHGALRTGERESGTVDLLLTDVVMPGGMSGCELGAKFKERNTNLKVIYTSGYIFNSNQQYAPELTESNFLRKPYPAAHLLELIRQQFHQENTL